MEAQGSLPYPSQPTTGPYHEQSETQKCESCFLSNAGNTGNSTALFEGLHASPAGPSDNSRIKIKMIV
jgi:hypothetical protein